MKKSETVNGGDEMTVSQLKDFLEKCEKSGFADKEADVVIETYDEERGGCINEDIVNAYLLDNGRVFLQGQSMREV